MTTTPPLPPKRNGGLIGDLKRLTMKKPFLFCPGLKHGDFNGSIANLKRTENGKYSKRKFAARIHVQDGVEGIGIWRTK